MSTSLELLDDRALLLATAEVLARSMNGVAMRRFSSAISQVAVSESLLGEEDHEWLLDGLRGGAKRRTHWADELRRLENDGVSVIACFDQDYPRNLDMIYDRPPILFVRGIMIPSDDRAVAVVGTRSPSDEGRHLASEIAGALAGAGVTIVSGLAKGVDTAAHAAALNAGGRTVAVFGTSIDRVYPASNKGLAKTIASSGACLSQFLPGSSTGQWSFPARNITTSGLSVGTIVVEAGESSGARHQAEASLAHGKRLFLAEGLCTHQAWAESLRGHPLVTVFSSANEVLDVVHRDSGEMVGLFP